MNSQVITRVISSALLALCIQSHIANLSAVFTSGNDSTVLKTKNPEYTVKRDFRLLRAKVINILREHFVPNPSTKLARSPTFTLKSIKPQKDTFKIIQAIEDNFRRIRNLELQNITFDYNNSSKILPKYHDMHYSPTVEDMKFSRRQYETPKSTFEKPFPTVDLLCKYLHPVELEHVCRDPIYFLGVESYQKDPNIANQKKWSKKGLLRAPGWEEGEDSSEEERKHKKTSGDLSSQVLKGLSFLEEGSKSPIKAKRTSHERDHEEPSIKKQELIKERKKAIKEKLKRDLERFKERRNQEDTNMEERIRKMRSSMNDKIDRADQLRKSIEEGAKEKIYASQQKQDFVSDRLKEARNKQTLEEGIKVLNLKIRRNLLDNVTKKNRDKTKLEKIKRATRLQTYSNRRDTVEPIYVDENVSSEGDI